MNPENEEAIARFLRLLPTGDDLTLIVLKGHILIEEQLLAIIQENVPYPNPIEADSLRYPQLARVAEALVYAEEDDWLWTAIQRLNKLRNVLAHELESPKLDHLIENFLVPIDAISARIGLPPSGSQLHERLKGRLAFLFGALSRHRGGEGKRGRQSS